MLFISLVSETSPDHQMERDKWIKDKVIHDILERMGLALKTFHYRHKLNQEEIDNYIYCKLMILDRLELLEKNKDKIFQYYSQHDNALKAELSKSIINTLNQI